MCGAVAAALVKLAFFPDQESAAAVTPGGSVTTPVVQVEPGDISDELTVDGTIARDDALTIRAQVEGTITKVAVAQGQSVAAGQVLFTVKQTDPVKNIDVTAPEAGDLTTFELVKGQSVTPLEVCAVSHHSSLIESQDVRLRRRNRIADVSAHTKW